MGSSATTGARSRSSETAWKGCSSLRARPCRAGVPLWVGVPPELARLERQRLRALAPRGDRLCWQLSYFSDSYASQFPPFASQLGWRFFEQTGTFRKENEVVREVRRSNARLLRPGKSVVSLGAGPKSRGGVGEPPTSSTHESHVDQTRCLQARELPSGPLSAGDAPQRLA